MKLVGLQYGKSKSINIVVLKTAQLKTVKAAVKWVGENPVGWLHC